MSSELSATPESTWSWPDLLDALTAAPDNHTLLLENERVRVIHARILPGQTVPVHTHRWPSVLFILTWSDVVRRDHLGNAMPEHLPEPKLNTPLWQGPLLPHSVENVGHAEINTVQVEVKGVPQNLQLPSPTEWICSPE
jgi:hypothetical protein